MSGTRALFASIGASVSLVAAAALSLLGVSAVFAFGGWSDPIAEPGRQAPLTLAAGKVGASSGAKQGPLVLAARERSRPARSVARASAAPSAGTVRGASRDGITQPATGPDPKASYPTPSLRGPETQNAAPPAPAATNPSKPSAGDGVRSAGEGLSGTVQSTGDALAQITDPLLPPVAAATQQVLDAVAELLRRSTDGLGRTVDGVLAPR